MTLTITDSAVAIGIALSLVSLIVAVVFPLLLMRRGASKRLLRFEIRQEQIHRTADDMLQKSESILREIEEATAAHHVRPELSVYFAKQWRFIEKTFHYRYEKHGICRRIVPKYTPDHGTVLLDSGSSIDLVTFELLTADVENVKVITNNVFAAMHLIGVRKVQLHLLSGRFNDRFAAVYDRDSVRKIESAPIDVYIMAATAIRARDGIMVVSADKENSEFKAAAIRAFRKNKDSKLVIAVDASKFTTETKGRVGVIPPYEWSEILNEEHERITVVTSRIREDTSPQERALVETEIDNLKERGVTVELGVEPGEGE